MSEIKRQSILATLFMYGGVILGALNVMVLYPTILSTAQYGFVTWLLIVGTVVSMVARLGVPPTIIKYFPHFKETKENGVLPMAFVITSIGIAIGLFLVWLLKDWAIGFYGKPESIQIIQENYHLLIPLFIFDVYFNILNAYSTSWMKAAVPIFFRDFFVRMLISICLILHWKGFLSFQLFLLLYTFAYGAQSIGLLIYLGRLGKLNFKWNMDIFRPLSGEMMRYALFVLFSGGGFYLIGYIDSLMVSALDKKYELDGMAIYRVFAYLGIFIMIPARSLFTVAMPVLANAWKENDLNQIEKLYKRTAIAQMVVGLGLFVLVWGNIDNFVRFLEWMKGENTYAAGKYVALFIGLGKLFDGATGINGGIIVTSKYYRYDLYFIVVLLAATILGNYLLIPILGMNGAAIATMSTAIVYNFVKYLFVKYKFNISPFDSNTWKAVLIGLAVLGLNYLLPALKQHFILDLLYRSIILGSVYLALVIYFDVSNDISRLSRQILGKVKGILGIG